MKSTAANHTTSENSCIGALNRCGLFREISVEFPLRITPGPFEVSRSVHIAASTAFHGHRSPAFREIVADTRSLLLKAFEISKHAGYEAVLFSGSGTSAMEAMVAALVPSSRPIALVNGRFGRRLADIAQIHNANTVVVDFGVGARIDLNKVEHAMKSGRTNQLIFCAQDTREGILNPIGDLCALAKAYDHRVIVDAISAGIVENLNVEANDIDAFTESSGKCIRGLPGISIVCAKSQLLRSLKAHESKTYYLNLAEEYIIQTQRSETRFAPAVALIYSLHQALTELIDEGVSQRRSQIRLRTQQVRNRLQQSVSPLRPLSEMPHSVTSYLLPPRWEFEAFQAALQHRGVLVYSGSSVERDCFQIGTGGYLTDSLLSTALDIIVDLLDA